MIPKPTSPISSPASPITASTESTSCYHGGGAQPAKRRHQSKRPREAPGAYDDNRQCLLVVIGANADGNKELLAIEDGFRESAQSWHELLLRLRDENGLEVDPELATGDGGLGFWKALHEIWPKTRQQRCLQGLLPCLLRRSDQRPPGL